MATPKTQELIDEHGDGAYQVAVRLTVMAVALGDAEGQEMFAACARELLALGYHKADRRGTGSGS